MKAVIATFLGVLCLVSFIFQALLQVSSAGAWADGFCYMRPDGEYPVYKAQQPRQADLDQHWLKCTDGEPKIGWWGKTD